MILPVLDATDTSEFLEIVANGQVREVLQRQVDWLQELQDVAAASQDAREIAELQLIVVILRIPGHGWWYAVTVIDYYSLTPSYSAPR